MQIIFNQSVTFLPLSSFVRLYASGEKEKEGEIYRAYCLSKRGENRKESRESTAGQWLA